MQNVAKWSILLICLAWCVLALFSNVMAWGKADIGWIVDDRYRLIKLDSDLIMEIKDTEQVINQEVDRINEMRKRKRCIEKKQRLYSDGNGFDVVSKFVCDDNYKKLQVVFN